MTGSLDRRRFLQYTAAAGAGAAAAALIGVAHADAAKPVSRAGAGSDFPWTEASIADMQTAMTSGAATALSITRDHLARIERMDWAGPRVNSII
jgi:amidase